MPLVGRMEDGCCTMLTKYIHEARGFVPEDAEAENSLLAALKSQLPRSAARRMSATGILVSGVVPPDSATARCPAVVYATRYGETVALEKYLGSLPEASPLLFQTSIHPSAVEQVWIARQQPIAEFLPLTATTAQDHLLLAAAIQQVFLCTSPETALIVAEERGTWLTEMGLASDCGFAASLQLSHSAEGALGRLQWSPPTDTGIEGSTTDSCSTLTLARAIVSRSPALFSGGGMGSFQLQWS